MVNATIDNPPVSIQLDISETTTVPTNETWKVTLSVFATAFDADDDVTLFTINNTPAIGITGDMDNGGAVSSPSDTFVLDGGDDIKLVVDGGKRFGGVIQGFVVNS
jgi:hypothetical protein